MPYVAELGASHLYLSPSLQARHGSTHGYDVADPTRISTDLGGEDEFRALCDRRPRRRPRRSSSTSSRTTWRPPRTRTPSGATRPRGRSSSTGIRRPAGTAASSTSASSPACASRIRKSSRRPTRRCSSSCTRASSTGCASTIPTASQIRASTWTAARAGAQHVWVEKILEPGEQLARLARRGHDRIRVRERRHGALRRPRGRGAADRALCGADRRAAHVRRGRA